LPFFAQSLPFLDALAAQSLLLSHALPEQLLPLADALPEHRDAVLGAFLSLSMRVPSLAPSSSLVPQHFVSSGALIP
jgi:hypothetical protein